MTLTVVCASTGAPGATTLACALGAVWPPDRRAVVVECDPSGGDLSARFGFPPTPGLTSLLLAARQGESGPALLDAHVQPLPGGLEALAGPIGAEAATSVDREVARLIPTLAALNADLLVDCGRLAPSSTGQWALAAAADRVIVVARPDVPSVAAVEWAIPRLASATERSTRTLVLVGPGPVRPDEAASSLDCGQVASAPWDPSAAAVIRGEPGRSSVFARSPLVRFAATVVEQYAPARANPTEAEADLADASPAEERAPSGRRLALRRDRSEVAFDTTFRPALQHDGTTS